MNPESQPPLRSHWSHVLRGLAVGLCFFGPSLLRAQSPEKLKTRSGIPFGEGPASGEALGASAAPAVEAKGNGSAAASAAVRDSAEGLPTGDVPAPQGQNTVDDVSRLNPTPVTAVRLPTTEEEIRQALAFARAHHVGVSMAGARHSQGGQIVYDKNVVLDMALYNKMSVDPATKILTVESGARWSDIQRYLDRRGLSMDVMQTHNVFSVGGSLSVNCHGSNPNSGPLGSTVKSMRIMLADGTVVTASPTERADLFHAAVGGYGLMGVILEVQIQVRDNELYGVETHIVDTKDYPEYFAKNIKDNPRVKYVHALLSTAPSNFLKKIVVMEYVEAKGAPPPMRSKKLEQIEYDFFNKTFFLAKSSWGQELFWLLASRGAKAAELAKFSRNQAMAEPMIAFRSNDPAETQILNEYFVPPERFPELTDRLREAVRKYKTTLTMAAARGVSPDESSMLSYSRTQRMALVLFFNQRMSADDNARMAAMTRELIQAAVDLGGTFYLPYQLVYTDAQLHAAYPNIDKFFDLKRRYDPNGLFMNKWYAKYGLKQAD